MLPEESVTRTGRAGRVGKDGADCKERVLSVRDKKVIDALSRLSVCVRETISLRSRDSEEEQEASGRASREAMRSSKTK